jgi:hypothetical protein
VRSYPTTNTRCKFLAILTELSERAGSGKYQHRINETENIDPAQACSEGCGQHKQQVAASENGLPLNNIRDCSRQIGEEVLARATRKTGKKAN